MARAGASSSWCPGKTARTIRPRRRSLAAPMPGSRSRLGPGCSARQRACIACRTKQMKKKTTREIQKRNQSKCSWRSGTIYKLGGQEQNTSTRTSNKQRIFFLGQTFDPHRQRRRKAWDEHLQPGERQQRSSRIGRSSDARELSRGWRSNEQTIFSCRMRAELASCPLN